MKQKLQRHLAAAAIAGAGALAALAAFAQTAPPPDDERTTTTSPPIIAKRLDRPGLRSDKRPGDVDWAAVRKAVQEMKERDEAFDRQIRAMTLTRAVSTEERERLRPKGLRPAAPEEFERVTAEQVKRPRLPLLAPLSAETASNLRIAARENAYTAFGDLPGGGSFEFIGTRMRVTVADDGAAKMRAAERRRVMKRLEEIDAPFVISHHEQGVDLSFSKFNCAYMLTIYCPDPDGDERCAKDDFVRTLASDIAILNADEGGGE